MRGKRKEGGYLLKTVDGNGGACGHNDKAEEEYGVQNLVECGAGRQFPVSQLKQKWIVSI